MSSTSGIFLSRSTSQGVRSLYLRFGTFGFEIRDFRYVVILHEGEIQLVPDCLTRLFSKNPIGVTIYLLNSLLLGISSHGYVKDIL